MNHRNRGLTLIEVLVVVTILSVLVLSLYTVFKTGMDAWSKSEANLEIFQNARVVLDLLTRELCGAFVGGGATFTGIDGGGGGSDTVEFITNYAGSLYGIKYAIEGTLPTLKRKYEENPDYSDPLYTPDYTDIALSSMVSNINFIYWDTDPDGDPGTNDAAWTTNGEWSKPTELPGAVKVVITLVDLAGNTYPFETTIYIPNS